ncbi:MAG: hypothetical protein K2N38_08265, partial [Oscillospiraceae bacterium]|nr:hypothetical protein [Oscillospiraceae bacterium]
PRSQGHGKGGAEKMKHGKKPTRKQKMLMKAAHYNCENWLVIKDTAEEMVIRNRQTDKTRTIRKELYK